LLTIASVPLLRQLNLSAVRERERVDAEQLYLAWAWKEFKRGVGVVGENGDVGVGVGVSVNGDALRDVQAWRAYQLAVDELENTENSENSKKTLQQPDLAIYQAYPQFKALCALHPSANPIAIAARSVSDDDALRDGGGTSLLSGMVKLTVHWVPSDFAKSVGVGAGSGGRGRGRGRGRGGVVGGRGIGADASVLSSEPKQEIIEVPVNMSVGDFHNLVKKTIGVGLNINVSLWYTNKDTVDAGGDWGFTVDDRFKVLSYYNVENQGIIMVKSPAK
jgi:hypothetical protein